MSTLKLKVNLLIWIWRIWLSYQISFFVFHILIFKNMTYFETAFCLVLKKQKSKFNDYKRVSNLSKYICSILPCLFLILYVQKIFYLQYLIIIQIKHSHIIEKSIELAGHFIDTYCNRYSMECHYVFSIYQT